MALRSSIGLDFVAFRLGLLSAMGLGGSMLVGCGPGLGGDTDGESEGSSATTAVIGSSTSGTSLTGATADTQDTLTTAASETMSESSDTADESSTSWGCDPYTEEWTERVCVPPYGEVGSSSGSSSGSTSGDGSTSGSSSGTGGEGSSSGDVDTATSTSGSPGAGSCDGYVDDPPDFPDSKGAWPEGWDGPFEEGTECCFDVHYFVGYPCGRPFLVGGEAQVAPGVERSDWASGLRPEVRGLSAEDRAELARQWLADAQAEHASIASFARFALELLAVGSPPQLLAETHAAMNDELQHARACFGLASAYAGELVGPGPLPLGAAMSEGVSLERVVEAAIIEGCVGETVAAMQAQLALANATDPAVIEALQRIAIDEAAHAALAWRFVRWALEQGGSSIRAAVLRTLEGVEALDAAPSDPFPGNAAHGRLSSGQLQRLRKNALREVIMPCAHAVLSQARLSSPPIADYLGEAPACPATRSTQSSSASGN